MAPMEAPARADAVSRADLQLALKDRKSEELLEMARRLQRSYDQLEAHREELVAEQQALREEGTQIQSTIELMMKEMQKLHIGSGNTGNTPGIDEGPLDFVGRLWERVKPRDTAVQLNEHVGELKKVPQATTKDGNQVAPHSVVEERVLNWWQQGQALAKQAMQTVQEALPDAAAGPAPREGRKSRAPRRRDGEARRPKADALAGAAEASGASTQPVASPSGGIPESVEAREGAAAPETASQGVAEAAKGAGETLPSTVLIEAKITLGDGSIQTLRVSATERPKDVAASFIKAHSLKPSLFVEPLTKFLKKVEDEADTFPAFAQADIMDIQQAHGQA